MGMGFVQVAITLIIIMLLVKPVGSYLVKVFDYEKTGLDRVFGPFERITYRMMGVREGEAMGWKKYLGAMLLTNFIMLILLFLVLRLQKFLPLNPDGIGNMPAAQAFNTAVSFITNTNWQSYSGENALSYLSQMLAVTFPMFTSAATGFAVAIAFIRGLIGRQDNLGNFYVDMTSFNYSYIHTAQLHCCIVPGVPRCSADIHGAVDATTLEGAKQTITRGLVASLESIKHIGTNGGGWFGTNAAHPFENPTPLTNLVHIVCMMLLPTALVYAFGVMIKNKKQGWAVFAAMGLIFLVMLTTVFVSRV